MSVFEAASSETEKYLSIASRIHSAEFLNLSEPISLEAFPEPVCEFKSPGSCCIGSGAQPDVIVLDTASICKSMLCIFAAHNLVFTGISYVCGYS